MFVLGEEGLGVGKPSWGQDWVRVQPGGRCRSRNEWKAPRADRPRGQRFPNPGPGRDTEDTNRCSSRNLCTNKEPSPKPGFPLLLPQHFSLYSTCWDPSPAPSPFQLRWMAHTQLLQAPWPVVLRATAAPGPQKPSLLCSSAGGGGRRQVKHLLKHKRTRWPVGPGTRG